MTFKKYHIGLPKKKLIFKHKNQYQNNYIRNFPNCQ